MELDIFGEVRSDDDFDIFAGIDIPDIKPKGKWKSRRSAHIRVYPMFSSGKYDVEIFKHDRAIWEDGSLMSCLFTGFPSINLTNEQILDRYPSFLEEFRKTVKEGDPIPTRKFRKEKGDVAACFGSWHLWTDKHAYVLGNFYGNNQQRYYKNLKRIQERLRCEIVDDKILSTDWLIFRDKLTKDWFVAPSGETMVIL